MRDARAGNIQADPQHRFFEQLTIFAFGDGLCICADQFHPVAREGAISIKLHRRIQRGLAAHGRQNRIRFFPFDDRLDDLGRNRLDVSPVRELGVGHDRGRIRINQDHFVAFFAQRLARLHAGIIEFAALPDHDRTGANEQNFLELIVPRHLARRRINQISRRSRSERAENPSTASDSGRCACRPACPHAAGSSAEYAGS